MRALSGSGANITALSAANISTGTLSVSRGGTGTGSFVQNQLIVGNGTNVPIQSASLSWNNTTNTLSATNIAGSGENITGLNIDNISAGVLPVSKGGTGANNLAANQLLVGNAANTPIQSANLTWNNTTNTLVATNITGNGSLINALNANNISSGTLSIARGGTGSSTLTADIIEQGTVKRFIENDTISMPNIPLNVNKILYMGASIVPTLDNIFSYHPEIISKQVELTKSISESILNKDNPNIFLGNIKKTLAIDKLKNEIKILISLTPIQLRW